MHTFCSTIAIELMFLHKMSIKNHSSYGISKPVSKIRIDVAVITQQMMSHRSYVLTPEVDE